MPRTALDNPLVLPVLGLLLEAPRHPHQLLAELQEPGRAAAAVVNRGSLYDVVAALAARGWVVEHARERVGRRPERTVYALSTAGRGELARRLDAQIRTPRREFPQFLGAVSHLGVLGRAGALNAVTERIARLRDDIDQDAAAFTTALSDGVPRLFVIEADYALHQGRAELAWLEHLAAEILDGTLAWPSLGAASAS